MIFHLYIEKGKEVMKTSGFQKDIGVTSARMKRLSIATKGCVQLTSNDTYFSDRWFSSIKTAEEVMAAGVDYCGPVKTIHKGFCLATLENSINNWPVGSYLVMKINPIVPGVIPLLAIGYN